MPEIAPGTSVIRLNSSTTGRSIPKGITGVIGGLSPSNHNNRVDRWPEYGYMPVQWVNGLWSNMPMDEQGLSWDFYPQEPARTPPNPENPVNPVKTPVKTPPAATRIMPLSTNPETLS